MFPKIPWKKRVFGVRGTLYMVADISWLYIPNLWVKFSPDRRLNRPCVYLPRANFGLLPFLSWLVFAAACPRKLGESSTRHRIGPQVEKVVSIDQTLGPLFLVDVGRGAKNVNFSSSVVGFQPLNHTKQKWGKCFPTTTMFWGCQLFFSPEPTEIQGAKVSCGWDSGTHLPGFLEQVPCVNTYPKKTSKYMLLCQGVFEKTTGLPS